MTYVIFTAIFLVVFVSGILIGIGLQKNRTYHLLRSMKRLHTQQLIKARIQAKLAGCQIGRMSARAALMPNFGVLAGRDGV